MDIATDLNFYCLISRWDKPTSICRCLRRLT
jgi:hypothetical protein